MIAQNETVPLPPDQAANLAEAFRLFNRVSAELKDAYADLQNQVGALTAELAEKNGELRRQYDDKARLSERLALLLDALPAGVVVVDANGIVEQCNPAAESVLGAQLQGCPWPALKASHLAPTQAPGEWTTGGGTVERNIAVAETELDSTGGRIVLLHDVTATHRMKREAQRNQHLAAMGEMAAALAHQLRTPLAAALLYTGNLMRPDIAVPERNGLAEKAISSLKHLERLIQDMLVFARGETTGREWFDISDLMAEVAQVVEPLARERSIAFSISGAPRQEQIHGDRKALVGGFINLLENALQACDTGGSIEMSAAIEQEGIVVRIRDDGRGIDPKTRARLFEPFFTTRPGGTGLGLAIARGVVRAHGGCIDLASPAPSGTEFIVQLPCRHSSADSCHPSQSESKT